MIQWHAAEIARLMQDNDIANPNQLREVTGLTSPTAYSLFNGARLAKVDTAVMEALGKAFGVDPRTLLDWTPD